MCHLGVTCQIVQPIQPIFTQIGLDWLCYLAGNSQTAPTIFFQIFSICFFFNYFIKNPQTAIALTFLTHIISAIGGVSSSSGPKTNETYPGIKINTTEKTTLLTEKITTKSTTSTTKTTTTTTTKITTFKPCKDTEWQCDSGDCIHRSEVCNYDHDCQDKSDECSDRAECDDRKSRGC